MARHDYRARTGRLGVTLTAVALSVTVTGGQAPPSAPGTPRVRIVAVDVQPAISAPDVLARLKVRLRNDGTESASFLAFEVTVNGHRLAPYINHSFLNVLEPGKETEVPLYNFWTSESSRPFPSDGRIVVEVRLTSRSLVGRWRSARASGDAAAAGTIRHPSSQEVSLSQPHAQPAPVLLVPDTGLEEVVPPDRHPLCHRPATAPPLTTRSRGRVALTLTTGHRLDPLAVRLGLLHG
jgi:hypothetical protein